MGNGLGDGNDRNGGALLPFPTGTGTVADYVSTSASASIACGSIPMARHRMMNCLALADALAEFDMCCACVFRAATNSSMLTCGRWEPEFMQGRLVDAGHAYQTTSLCLGRS